MERFAEELAGWLAGQGHEVTVATLTPADRDGDRGRPYRVLRSPQPGQLVRSARQADVVHINGLSVRGVAAALLAARRPVITHQGHQAICPTGMAWNRRGRCEAGPRPGPCGSCREVRFPAHAKVRAHRLAARVARADVCISRYLADRLGICQSRLIYNAVSWTAFEARAGGPGQDGLVVFAGRLVAEKGLGLLLQALALVPGARLEVAGDGPLRAEWEELARSLGVASRVRFLGSLPLQGVVELYARAAVVCVPSLWDEPFGYAAAEAMAMERPVVATPRGALPELLADGRGFLASEPTPEALAAALDAAMGDDPARLEAAARARAFALSEFALDVVGTRYMECYQQAAGRKV